MITARILWSTWENAHGLGAGAVIAALRGHSAEGGHRDQTVTNLSANELCAGLRELLELVDQVAALESRIEFKAMGLGRCDWGDDFITSRYVNALAGQLKGIYTEANADTRENEWDPHDLAEDIRAAIDIVNLSTKASDDAR